MRKQDRGGRQQTTAALLALAGALALAAAAGAARPHAPSAATAVVEITGSTPEWRDRLVQALAVPGTTVRLAWDVDLDLSGLENIFVAQGVTLTSERPADPTRKPFRGARPPVGGVPLVSGRTPQRLGPRLYTTTRPHPLFTLVCDGAGRSSDGVRFSGFRLQGPHWDTMDGDDNLERGIQVDSCTGVEIANMELSGWSGQAVYLVDSKLRQLNPNAVRIHDSFIHHNQHVGGNGYGVDVGKGAYAAIERNVFDYNRHAIAASGKAGTGYRAAQNLVLRGGGVHGKWYSNQTHLFDVHGDANCPDIPGNRHTWNCGNAGDQFWYLQNAFQYTKDNAIKLRGAPRVQAVIEGNVFAHSSLGDAVKLNDRTRVLVGTNRVGIDSYGRYGVCDFDGDGRDDLFLPTGVTWWYASGGSMQWTYLNTASELLDQLRLGDFDGDGRCDVLAVHGAQWDVSSGGRTPWRTLGAVGVPLDQIAFGQFVAGGPTDVFRRAPDGQWYVLTPPSLAWKPVQSSSFPLSALRFGDFTGDGITDVLALQGGRWSISRSATGSWETLNPAMSSRLDGTIVADVDGNGVDDVVRFEITRVDPSGSAAGRWLVSWGGRTGWQELTGIGFRIDVRRTSDVRVFAGRFDGSPGVDLLLLDSTRDGRIYSRAAGKLATLNRYSY